MLLGPVAQRKRQQPQRGLLVVREVGDRVDCVLDVAEGLLASTSSVTASR